MYTHVHIYTQRHIQTWAETHMQTYKSMQTKAPRKQKHPKTHMHTHPHTRVRESKRRGERKSAARLHYRLLTLCPAALAHRVSRPRGTGSVGDSAGEGTNEKLGANMAAEKLGANMANMAVHTLSRIDTLSRVSRKESTYLAPRLLTPRARAGPEYHTAHTHTPAKNKNNKEGTY